MAAPIHTYQDPDLLLADFRNGKEAALDFIFNHHYPSLHAFTMRLVNDEDLANDVVVESFMKLWKKRTLFTDIRGLVGYMYAIIRNTAYAELNAANKYKKKTSELAYLSDKFEDWATKMETEEIRAKLLQLVWHDMKEMPPKMKEVFRLAYLEGKLAPEIAKILNVSVNTVKTHKKIAMKKVRDSLRKKGYTNWMIILELIARENTLN
jgi:RNA polymerase sigma factor (sigma-70 family)